MKLIRCYGVRLARRSDHHSTQTVRQGMAYLKGNSDVATWSNPLLVCPRCKSVVQR